MRITALFAAAGIASIFFVSHAAALEEADIFGVWRHPVNGSLIQIYRCSRSICAKVVRVSDPTRKDVHNSDPAQRNRPIVGTVILRHAKATGRLQWTGSLYNTLDGGTYHGSLRLINRKSLALSGCYLSEFLCQRYIWIRVEQ